MTVFEDLIVELKEENLLEDTVISVKMPSKEAVFSTGADEHDFADLIDSEPSLDEELPLETGAAIVGADAEAPRPRAASAAHKYAVDQVATFQMVEHVLTSIERNKLNRETRGYDELGIKKALHKFQQATADPDSMDFAEAEAGLVHEVSVWQKNLAARDAEIAVSVMRQYCETCQPALSAQALFSLARFYRSLPYSEFSRGKFEFLVTRLFSRRGEGERRTVICSKDEMLGHLRSRFRDASDVYANIAGDDADVMLAVLTFDDFNGEAEAATSFEELVTSNFFGRLFHFKEVSGRNFFAPTVAGAAISSNIAIAAKILDLLAAEREAGRGAQLLEKYASFYDESISDALGRTLKLKDMLIEAPVEESVEEVEEPVEKREVYHEVINVTREGPAKTHPKKAGGTSWLSFAGVNKWLLATTMVVVVISVGLFIWANYYGDTAPPADNVARIDISNTQFSDVVKEARLSGETFYGITTTTWDGMTKEAQQEVLTKLIQFGVEKGFKRVSLINNKGQTVGYAVNGRADVFRL